MKSLSLFSVKRSVRRSSAGRRAAVPPALQTLAAAAGFRFDGDAPWDIRVADARLYQRVLLKGSLGFGESYMEGWWECERLDQLFHRLLSVEADQTIARWTYLKAFAEALRKGGLDF